MRREDIFFAILRSVMWGTKANVPADTDWREVLNLAARQKCLHAFGMWIRKQRISIPFDKHLQTQIFTIMQRQVRLNHLATNVISLLDEHNIPATLIKGYSLSVLYPDPDTRDFGDVDIYVGEENYLRAAEIVTAAYPDAHWHSETYGGIHYILVIDESQDRVVELHRVTMEFADARANALYQSFTQKYLYSARATMDVCGQAIPVPPAAYNALYVFMHAWHHFESSGVGFRQLADWALCLSLAYDRSSSQQWQILLQEIDPILKSLKMKTAWQTFGHILVNELHLPKEAFPFHTPRYQKRAKRLLSQLLRDGHCGRPATFNIKEIALMRRFPWERPAEHRVMQIGYTFCRLLFETWQMSKLFPSLALHELRHSLCRACTKKRTSRSCARSCD